MLIRHPTSGLFWSVNDDRELSLAKEGSVYVKSTCDVPPHLFHFDDNTSHLKNTVTGKCICRIGDKLVESDHGGVNNTLFEWTMIDGMIQSYMDKYVDGDLSLVDKTDVQWNVGDSFEEIEQLITETVAEVLAPAPAEEVPAPVEAEEVEEPAPVVEEEDVPVARASALIEEALNAQAEPEEDDDVPELVSDEEEPEIEEAIAETVDEVLAPVPVTEEAPTDEVEA